MGNLCSKDQVADQNQDENIQNSGNFKSMNPAPVQEENALYQSNGNDPAFGQQSGFQQSGLQQSGLQQSGLQQSQTAGFASGAAPEPNFATNNDLGNSQWETGAMQNPANPEVEKTLSRAGQFSPEMFPEQQAACGGSDGQSAVLNPQTGSTYEGQTRQGNPHGWGTLTAKDGTVVQGFFQEGEPHFVRKASPSGALYEGPMKGGVASGQGKLTCTKTGAVLTGNFVNDKLEGKGLRKSPCGESYEGEFKNGVENGEGLQTLVDGRQIKTVFVDGKPSGKGELITDSGRKIQSSWKNGVRV